ncbi:helix-turn-helix domain-containing protein [Terrarubrum flagellatum]|uniref:helix-turn-helix domain-containing protein n=1 Tax=Terrirubrum flagellatum TaxID=2895980 RepID=UPI00314542CF
MSSTKIVSDDALFTVKEARQFVSAGVTRIYELLNRGQLEAKKSGRRTLITGASINNYRAAMPFYQPRQTAT